MYAPGPCQAPAGVSFGNGGERRIRLHRTLLRFGGSPCAIEMDVQISAARKGSTRAMMELYENCRSWSWFLCRTLAPESKSATAATGAFQWAAQQVMDGRIEEVGEFEMAFLLRTVISCRMETVWKDKKAFRMPAGTPAAPELDFSGLDTSGDGVQAVLSVLPVAYRYVWLAQMVAGCTPEEIARATDINPKTVTRILDAREPVLRQIAGRMPEGVEKLPDSESFHTALMRAASAVTVPDSLNQAVQKEAEKLCAPAQKTAHRKQLGIGIGVAVVLVAVLLLLVPRFSGGKTDANGDSSAGSGAAGSAVSSTTGSGSDSSSAGTAGSSSQADSDAVNAEYQAEISIQDYGTITVKLDRDAAPKTVDNFVSLARSGFYDGLKFHRIMEGFMMQGGDGSSSGRSAESIPGEFSSNGFDNPLSHTRGAISMARTNDPDSASSQFFIVHQDSTFLDGQYAAFGYVTDGMDVVDAICESAQPTDDNGTIPEDEQPVIETITITETQA